ncbi:MAG: hypothetical protein ABEI31_05650 [Halodesulfurarchaeum sp.]
MRAPVSAVPAHPYESAPGHTTATVAGYAATAVVILVASLALVEPQTLLGLGAFVLTVSFA